MALTKDERRALELARELIRTDKECWICWALDDVAKRDATYREAVNRLTNYVGIAIEGAVWLTGWQRANGLRTRTHSEAKADRLAWIDWMLGKPLPGEQVEIIWFSKDTVHSTAEYCGREFYAKREVASTNHCVFEKTESRGMVKVCEGDDFAKINAAIVAHVWPEA